VANLAIAAIGDDAGRTTAADGRRATWTPAADGGDPRPFAVLRDAGESAVDRVLTYGEPCERTWIAKLGASAVSALDPLAMVVYDRSGMRPDEPSGRFATALGAAMLP
jgi:hypothetical protein